MKITPLILLKLQKILMNSDFSALLISLTVWSRSDQDVDLAVRHIHTRPARFSVHAADARNVHPSSGRGEMVQFSNTDCAKVFIEIPRRLVLTERRSTPVNPSGKRAPLRTRTLRPGSESARRLEIRLPAEDRASRIVRRLIYNIAYTVVMANKVLKRGTLRRKKRNFGGAADDGDGGGGAVAVYAAGLLAALCCQRPGGSGGRWRAAQGAEHTEEVLPQEGRGEQQGVLRGDQGEAQRA